VTHLLRLLDNGRPYESVFEIVIPARRAQTPAGCLRRRRRDHCSLAPPEADGGMAAQTDTDLPDRLPDPAGTRDSTGIGFALGLASVCQDAAR
jgi:hypothetical protein